MRGKVVAALRSLKHRTAVAAKSLCSIENQSSLRGIVVHGGALICNVLESCRVTPEEGNVFCPHCGTQAAPESRFCHQCGAAMPGATRSEGVAVSLPAQSGRRSVSRPKSHWKLLVGLLLLLAVLGAGVAAGIVSLVMYAIKSSYVAQEAISRARSSQAVAQSLGVPIKEAWFVTGSINESPGSGSADFTLPISGPKGKGTLYVMARKVAGAWQYSLIEVDIKGSGDRINLLNANPPSGAMPRTPAPPPSSADSAHF